MPKYKKKQPSLEDAFMSILGVLTEPRRPRDKTASAVNMTKAPTKWSQIEECFFDHPYGGIRAVITFPNGYSASIIQTSFSYGSPGTFELAVMDKNGDITYDTPITDDVVGGLSKKEVLAVCLDIFNLPAQK